MINNIDEVQQEIHQIIPRIKYESPQNNWGQTHKVSNNFSINFIDQHNLQKTKKMIIDNLKVYCQEINYMYDDNFDMESWMTSFTKNDYAKTHNHGYCDISGVYYFKTNGDDGDLIFENHNNASVSKCFCEKYAQNWIHKPNIGKILLFPSWVLHYVSKNLYDTERNSLAFNIRFK